MAAALPSLTPDSRVIITMSRIGPTIVKSPYNWDSSLSQILKEDRIVNIVSMEIMDMD